MRLPRPQGALGAVNSFRDLFSAVIGVGMVGGGMSEAPSREPVESS